MEKTPRKSLDEESDKRKALEEYEKVKRTFDDKKNYILQYDKNVSGRTKNMIEVMEKNATTTESISSYIPMLDNIIKEDYHIITKQRLQEAQMNIDEMTETQEVFIRLAMNLIEMEESKESVQKIEASTSLEHLHNKLVDVVDDEEETAKLYTIALNLLEKEK